MKRNLVQALKKLLVAFGGAKDTSEITDTNIVPIVDKIAESVSEFNNNSGEFNNSKHWLIPKQTIVSTTEDTSGIYISNAEKPYFSNSTDFLSLAEMIFNDPNDINLNLLYDYLDEHIVVIINNKKVFIDRQLSFSQYYPSGSILWTLNKDNNLIGILWSTDSDWFTVAGNFTTFLPIDAEYTIEAYEIIQQQETNNLNLPVPNEDNVDYVLTSKESETESGTYEYQLAPLPTQETIEPMILTYSQDYVNYLSKTFKEVKDAYLQGIPIIFDNGYNCTSSLISIDSNEFKVYFSSILKDDIFINNIQCFKSNDDTENGVLGLWPEPIG